MSSQIKQELPLVNPHNFDSSKCILKELSFKNIFSILYSYDDIRINLPLNIFLEYVQIIKLGKFNTIMVNLENSKNFLNIHTKLCSLYNCVKVDNIIFIKFNDKISQLTLIPSKSSNKIPIQVSSYMDLESFYKDFYHSYNLKSKLILQPILNKNTFTISYQIIDGEISYPTTIVKNSIKADIHKVKLNQDIQIIL